MRRRKKKNDLFIVLYSVWIIIYKNVESLLRFSVYNLLKKFEKILPSKKKKKRIEEYSFNILEIEHREQSI